MDYVKLVGLLMQLPDAVKREVALGVATSREEIAKLGAALPSMIDSALSAKFDPVKADLDAKVKAALDKLEAEGVDLSKLEEAISGLGNGVATDANSKGVDLSALSKSLGDLGKAPEGDSQADDSKRADVSSFKPLSTIAKSDDGVSPLDKPADLGSALKPVDPAAPVNEGEMQPDDGTPPADGSAPMAGALNTAGGTPGPGTAGGETPADAGKAAAEKAKAAGLDEVAAAAHAAYVRAVDLTMSPAEAFQAANDAAREAGAGIPEAARAASNASA